MIECQSVVRKWGNSLGLTISKEVAETLHLKENKKINFIILEDDSPIKKTFGLLKGWKTSTTQIMKDMRAGNWDE
ncbi:AbrB/MazE/SpoVT family DNA-binding domain-containing protein [Candidatus Woesearchaeota archaeon]|nr:AbrB/MazE/SpoVT family DNA-binding domain-containing protein [Candidatus Woesearchaeota archaeon]